MNSLFKRNGLQIFCAALTLFTCQTFATTDITISKMANDVMPEGCGNPYQDVAAFLGFYDLTIETIAATRGPHAKGVPELFAVSEIKKALDTLLTNPQEESPLDRLISSQLCNFQKIQTTAKMQGQSKADPVNIKSADAVLHDHLVLLAPKLFRDARKLAVEILAERSKEKQKNGILEQKWAEIHQAREEGRAKIRDLFD